VGYKQINAANLQLSDIGRDVFKKSTFHINGKASFHKAGQLLSFTKAGKLFIGKFKDHREAEASECFFEETIEEEIKQ
jgi:hypothetical protein